jgi:membrane protein YdbS with pleckstrin-like domain
MSIGLEYYFEKMRPTWWIWATCVVAFIYAIVQVTLGDEEENV